MKLEARLAAYGAVSAFVAVVMGAFGAHGLKSWNLPPERLIAFDTGARYQMYHAFALFASAWAAEKLSAKWAGRAGFWFIGGTVLFSWSLYALVLLDQKWLGRITPIGGLSFLAGWACLAAAALTSREPA